MRIRMVTLLAGPEGVLEAGREYDLEPKHAARLIHAGAAAEVIEAPALEAPEPDAAAETAEAPPPAEITEPVHAGGGYYKLFTGETVRGKKAAHEAHAARLELLAENSG